jgi:hypothetical protein
VTLRGQFAESLDWDRIGLPHDVAANFSFTLPNRGSLIKQEKVMSASPQHTSMNILSSIPLVVTSALVDLSLRILDGGSTHVAQMIIRLVILAWARRRAGAEHPARASDGAPAVGGIRGCWRFSDLRPIATMFTSPYAHPSRQWLIHDHRLCDVVLFACLLCGPVGACSCAWTVVIVMMGVGEAALAILQGLRPECREAQRDVL